MYRPEIDGLRAIAVGAVILFHAGLSPFGGGFLGVDIFFVISGYLITGIIYRQLASGTFSVWHFYDRRIRRIIPALTVVMVISTPISYSLMLPDDLENFGQSLVATSLFSNNILLLLTSGYFALEAEFKPLMHTWSLAVEEQYYFIVPLVLLIAYGLGKRRGDTGWHWVFWLLAAITAASIAFSHWASANMPTANFLLIFSRAWELGLGGLAVLIEASLRRWREAGTLAGRTLAWCGLVMIVSPLFLFDMEMQLPGWPTLIPVLGTCLILVFARSDTGPGRLLATPPFVGLGLISYSAYLYHQPVFAFARIASLEEVSPLFLLALIPVILAFAWLSWRFVEQPFRSRDRIPFPAVAGIMGTASAAVLALGLTMHFSSGFYGNWPELGSDTGFGARQNIAYNTQPDSYLNWEFEEGTDKSKVLVLGNSFARDFINAMIETGRIDHVDVSFSNFGDCETGPFSPTLRMNVERADFIVLGSGIEIDRYPCAVRRIEQLRNISRAPITVLGTKNFGYNNNAVMLLPAETRYKHRVKPIEDIINANEFARNQFQPEKYVDIIGMLSDEQGRVPVFTPDGKFISQDRNHLTKAGAAYVGSVIFEHPALRQIGIDRAGRCHSASC